jgi:hypothetical protein
LEKRRGKMGMTWKVKAVKAAVAVGIVGALAMAAGADWVFCFLSWLGL